MRHAFSAISHHRQAISRLNFALRLLAIMVVISGCAGTIRAPVRDVVAVPRNVQNIPIGLVDIAVIPPNIPKGDDVYRVSFPDEIAIDRKGSHERGQVLTYHF